MSPPRYVVPGVFLVTRTTYEGQFFLHPYQSGRLKRTGKRIRNFCGYALGVYSQRYDIHVGAYNYLSNHVQQVLYDPFACLPDFMRDHNSIIGRFIRFLRRQPTGVVWDPSQKPNVVELASAEAILQKLAYVTMQQVKDGNLHKPHHWDGLASRPETLLKPETFYRDDAFFRTENDGGKMPATVTLQPRPMPRLQEALGDDYADTVRRHCYDFVKGVKRADGRPVLGRKAVRNICWTYKPKPKARRKKQTLRKQPDGSERPDGPVKTAPTFTYRTRAEFFAQVQKRKGFRRDYRKRRVAQRAGDHTSPWPYGTFHMCRRLGAPQAIPD